MTPAAHAVLIVMMCRADGHLLMIKRIFLSCCAAMCLTPSVSLYGQTTVAEWEAHWAEAAKREARWAADEAAAAAKRSARKEAIATFLDSSRSKEERLAASNHLGSPEKEILPALLAVGADHGQDDAIRWEALRRQWPASDKWLDVVLKILADPKDGGEELHTNLIRAVSSRMPRGMREEVKPRILATFRKIFDDPRENVRIGAFHAAVCNDDSIAMNLVTESLRKGKDFPIPLASLMDLAARYPGHYVDVLRPYLDHTDPQVQAIAAHSLSVDPKSRPMIVAIIKNPNAPEVVRTRALSGMIHKDPTLADYALPLMEDINENPKVRHAAMMALLGRMNWHKTELAIQSRYAKTLEKIAADQGLTAEEARELREDAKKLLPGLWQRFR